MERAVDGLENLIREHGLDCDMTRPGFLRMATTPSYVRRLRHDVELVTASGSRASSGSTGTPHAPRSIRRSTWVRCGSRDSCS